MSTRRSPRAAHQRDYVPDTPSSASSSDGGLAAGGPGPWSPTMAHLPELTFNPLVPEPATLPGGGVLQWTPGVPRNPELDMHSFDDLHGTKPPVPPARAAHGLAKPPSEQQSTAVVIQLWATRALLLLLLLGAGATMLAILDPTLFDGINIFRDTEPSQANVPSSSSPPPPPPRPVYIEVVGVDSCEATGCASIASTEECAAAAMDVHCDVGAWYCSSGVCVGDPVAVSRSPTSVLTHDGAVATYMPGCSISMRTVPQVGRPPAPTPMVNFRSNHEIPTDSQNPLPQCSDATKCICDCQQLVLSLTEPDQQWWCRSPGQERDEARPAGISPSLRCQPDWPSCFVSPQPEPEPSESTGESSSSSTTAKSSGVGQRLQHRAKAAPVTAAMLLAAASFSG